MLQPKYVTLYWSFSSLCLLLCGILGDYKKILPYLGTLKEPFATHNKMNTFVSYCESVEQSTFFPLSTLAQSETFLICIRRFQVLVSAGTPTTLRSFLVFLSPFRPNFWISPRLRLQPLPFTPFNSSFYYPLFIRRYIVPSELLKHGWMTN